MITTPKAQGATVNLIFDFISDLGVAETILTQVVTAVVYSGTDANPGNVISGVATLANPTQVQQKITAGVIGVIYTLVCKITTSFGQTLQKSTYLAIATDIL